MDDSHTQVETWKSLGHQEKPDPVLTLCLLVQLLPRIQRYRWESPIPSIPMRGGRTVEFGGMLTTGVKSWGTGFSQCSVSVTTCTPTTPLGKVRDVGTTPRDPRRPINHVTDHRRHMIRWKSVRKNKTYSNNTDTSLTTPLRTPESSPNVVRTFRLGLLVGTVKREKVGGIW